MEQIKEWAKKNPNLTSLIIFVLFFLSIAYIFNFGLQLALIFSISLAVHEYSHVLAMRILKIPVKAVLFIPLMGAVAIGGGGKMWTRREECLIALAGPIAGYLTALPIYFLWVTSGNPIFATGMLYIIIINLFNMLPLSPLDGGRVMKSVLMSIKRKYRIVGFVIWGIIAVVSILLLVQIKAYFIGILIAFFAYQEFKGEWQLYQLNIPNFASLSTKQMAFFGLMWLALACWPFVAMVLWGISILNF